MIPHEKMWDSTTQYKDYDTNVIWRHTIWCCPVYCTMQHYFLNCTRGYNIPYNTLWCIMTPYNIIPYNYLLLSPRVILSWTPIAAHISWRMNQNSTNTRGLIWLHSQTQCVVSGSVVCRVCAGVLLRNTTHCVPAATKELTLAQLFIEFGAIMAKWWPEQHNQVSPSVLNLFRILFNCN